LRAPGEPARCAGRLCRNPAKLTDEEVKKLTATFRTSFGMGMDENGHPST